MELWAKIDGQIKKFQGSFKKVMEDIVREGRGKEVQLMSFHAEQKVRRRFKRELREYDKDLVKTASAIAIWFYTIEARKLRRRIKELKKKAKYISKGEVYYCPKIMEQVKELEKNLEEVQKKIEELKV